MTPTILVPMVRINPTTKEHHLTIQRRANNFWLRESSGGMTRLIPVTDGIPWAAEFIFVPNEDVIYPEESVGYGKTETASRSRK